MKKKILSMLMAGTMLASVLPAGISYAAESYPAAKFGIKSGDRVIFGSAGTSAYSAPARLVALDVDKTSTKDASGMFFMSYINTGNIALIYENAEKGIDSACTQYLEVFSTEEQNALISTTKSSSYQASDSLTLGEDITNKKIFALSAGEATDYKNLIPKQSDWWLRSYNAKYTIVYRGMCGYRGYVDINGAIGYSDFKELFGNDGDTKGFYPGMNISKEKTVVGTPAGNRTLLLPENGDGTFAALSDSASKPFYRLSVRDEEITSVKPGAVTIEGRNYTFPVTTNQTSSRTNEYISAIVTDSAENILAYGRFEKTGLTTNISLTLPDGIDQSTCKLYVFNEVYNSGKSGKISDLSEVCTAHTYTLDADLGDGTHRFICTKCGYTMAEEHTYGAYESADDETHAAECSVCGSIKSEPHSTVVKSLNDTEHQIRCTVCGYQKAVPHTLQKSGSGNGHVDYCAVCKYRSSLLEPHQNTYEQVDQQYHQVTCTECGRGGKEEHALSYKILYDNTGKHQIVCTLCNAELGTAEHEYEVIKQTAYNDGWHNKQCKQCGRLKQERCTFGMPVKASDAEHYRSCTQCGVRFYEAHTLNGYEDQKDGTHLAACSGCGFSKTEPHSYVFEDSENGMKKQVCSGCKVDTGIWASIGAVPENYFDRTGAVVLNSVSTTAGTAWHDGAPNGLFTESDNKFGGDGVLAEDGSYELGAKFWMKNKVKLAGIAVKNAYDTSARPARQPKEIELFGITEDGAKEFLGAVSTDGLMDAAKYDNYNIFFANEQKAYQTYELILRGTSQQLQLGRFIPLGAEGRKMEFSLDGVSVSEQSDYIVSGETYTCTLVSLNAHPKTEDVSVTLDGQSFTDYTYSEENGILQIAGDKVTSGSYLIHAFYELPDFHVTTELYRMRFSGAKTAKYGTDYSFRLTDSYGGMKWFPGNNGELSVKIAGEEIYEFDFAEDGTITIPRDKIIGDIEIYAEEHACRQRDDSVYMLQTDHDIPRYFERLYDLEESISGVQNVRLTLLADRLEYNSLYLSEGNVEINFDGHTLTYGDSTALIQNHGAEILLRDGVMTAARNGIAGSVYGGSVTLENMEIRSREGTYGNGFSLSGEGTLYVNGVQFTNGHYDADNQDNSSISISYANNGGRLVVSDGTFTGPICLNSFIGSLELSGGEYAAIMDNQERNPDFFGMLADGYAYQSTSTETREINDMFSGNALESVRVVKSPFAASKEEMTVSFGYQPMTVSAGIEGENLSYQWYCDGKAIQQANSPEYQIPSGYSHGTKEYLCVVSDGTNYAAIKRITLKVKCAHEGMEGNTCPVCQVQFCAAVTNSGVTEYFENFMDAAAALADGGTLTLLDDVTVYAVGDVQYQGDILIKAEDAVIDLNDHTISGTTSKAQINVDSSVTIHTGAIRTKLYFRNKNSCPTLKNLVVTDTLTSECKKMQILSGTYMILRLMQCEIQDALGEGLALWRTNTQEWYQDTAQSAYYADVRPKPAWITKQPESVNLPTGYTDGGVLTVAAERNLEKYPNSELTYQWCACDISNGSVALDGETSPEFHIPSGLAEGETRAYHCLITCEGYKVVSKTVYVSVGEVKPEVFLEQTTGDVRLDVYGNGREGIVVVAGYQNNGKLVNLKTVPITRENNQFTVRLYEELGLKNASCYKFRAYVLEDLKTLRPIGNMAEFE